MKLYNKIFVGLVLGTVVGAGVNAAGLGDGPAWTEGVLPVLNFVGRAFVRLITMIVIPLVVASLMLGVASLGDIRTLTVAEYRASSRWMRFCYRFYRSMPVMLGLGPICQFVFKHRLPVGMPWKWRRAWRSVAINNLALCALIALVGSTLGWTVFLAVHAPVVAIAGALGVWLFYVQHCYEHGYWERGPRWDARRAALEGSSFYDLTPVLRWITCNIGYHHIHHLSARIPNYHLRAAHEALPLAGVRRFDLRGSLACARMKLWDEGLGRMVDFPRRMAHSMSRA